MAPNLSNFSLLTPVSFACYFVMSAMLAPMGILAPEMAQHFDLPVTAVTRTFGALTIGNLIGAAFATAALTIWNFRSIFISTYATLGISLLLLGSTDHLLFVGAILGVVGFGCGVGLAAAAALITLRFTASKKASMLILTDACFSIAGFLLSWIATTLIYFQFGWAVAYQLVGVICLAILIASCVSDFSNVEQEQDPDRDSISIKTWPVNARWLGASLFLYTLGQYSFLLWLPKFASDFHSAGPILSGGLVAQFWFGMFAAQLFTSWWVFRVGTERLVSLASGTIFLGSLFLLFAPSAEMLPIFAFAWGFLNLSFLKATISLASENFAAHPSNFIAVLLLCATAGTAISPLLTSDLADTFGAIGSLVFGSVCYALLVVTVALARLKQKPTI
jgi:TsgA-like MFS transporter